MPAALTGRFGETIALAAVDVLGTCIGAGGALELVTGPVSSSVSSSESDKVKSMIGVDAPVLDPPTEDDDPSAVTRPAGGTLDLAGVPSPSSSESMTCTTFRFRPVPPLFAPSPLLISFISQTDGFVSISELNEAGTEGATGVDASTVADDGFTCEASQDAVPYLLSSVCHSPVGSRITSSTVSGTTLRMSITYLEWRTNGQFTVQGGEGKRGSTHQQSDHQIGALCYNADRAIVGAQHYFLSTK